MTNVMCMQICLLMNVFICSLVTMQYEIDYVYTTVCDEKQMANKPKHESHGHTKLARSKFTSAYATNSDGYDTVNTATIE